MKFYFVRFTHIESSKEFYKFGITSKTDVLERFNPKYDSRYKDFIIQVMYSAYGSNEQVELLESKMLKKFPKNIYLESYLNLPKGYYDGLSGITEISVMTYKTVDRVIKVLIKLKDSSNNLCFK